MKNQVKILFTILGVLFVAIVVTSITRPLLNRAAMSFFSHHETSSYLLSFVLRVLPLVAVFALAGFTCTVMIGSARQVVWTIFTIVLGAILSHLFYYNSLAYPLPFRPEIEIHLSYAVPLIGLAFGTLIGLVLYRSTSGSSPTR
ncbi:MAG: hypothetical protein A2X57_01000 [Nitrospirae bacterium GWD2_57_8]|nr:MAG: hypothetical protein A2X57_01000 [Nitrospirae bacterium GWD2_57_8]